MSLYDDASLILYPSGYKEDKIYSLKPTDGSGDLTFTRASTATRVNSEGLIEESPVNLLLQSNSFSTTWTNTSTTETSGQSGYDGTNNAWLLTKPATSFARIQQTFSSTSGLKTFSVYLKAGTLSWCRLFAGSAPSPNIYVNLSNGSLGSQYDNISATSTDVGAGWYRVSLTFDASISEIRIYPADANDSVSGISGNIYIQDAQLEASVQATEYIPTTTTAVSVGMLANVPRIDYTGGGCGKLLLERQRTNLIPYSNAFNFWTLSGDGVGQSQTSNYAISPDGTNNATRLQLNKTGGTFSRLSLPVTGTIGGASIAYTIYLKANIGTSNVYIQAGGNIGSAINVTSEWTRYEIKGNAPGTTTTCIVGIADSVSGTSETADILIYGAQLEQGSYPTSYIPTTTTAVTRVVDDYSLSNIRTNGLISASGGSWLVHITNNESRIRDGGGGGLYLNESDAFNGSNGVRIGQTNSGLSQLKVVIYLSGVATTFNLTDEEIKVAFSWNGTTLDLWVNGTKEIDAMAFTFTDMEFLGSNLDVSYIVQNELIFPTALSDDDLTLLTGTLGETYFESYALMANYLNYTIQ